MKTKTLVMAAAIIAATASLALVPTFTSTAMADRGGFNPGETTTCYHNGNLRQSDGPCKNEHSGDTVTICKFHGKPTTDCPEDT